MPETYSRDGSALIIRFNAETIRIEPWGRDALRVRARPGGAVVEPHVSALLPAEDTPSEIEIDGPRASLTTGRIRAEVRLVRRLGAEVPKEPEIRFVRSDTGEELLAETRSHFAGPSPRNFKAIAGGSFQLEARFRAYPDESLMGLGQPQHGLEDLKGTSTTLVQQNTHVVVPFVLSSRGYGFLWNNPATGRADFATNVTRWLADATPGLDYWITAGDSPTEILSRYVGATGQPPQLPDWATGFWQCKLRYRSQAEILEVAREYRRRNLPLSCIVIDFFAWTRQGEWQFDPADWPDPEGLVRELDEMGIKTIVSIWPTVAANAETYDEMREKGYLLRTERGVPVVIQFPDKDPYGIHFLTYYDPFNPEARDFHWDRVQKGYVDKGFTNFWLDACEPEMRPAHSDHVRTHLGNGAEMLSAFPFLHASRYAEGLRAAGAEDPVLLCRSTWAGGQRFPTILWSGDVWSTWEDYRAQIAAGLHAAISGIGWWTTDIGGFYEGHRENPEFHELLVRWFEFGVMSPICRLHGVRVPNGVPFAAPDGEVDYGRELFRVFTDTGGDNEVWSYTPELLDLFTGLLELRERLRPYLDATFAAYSASGVPPMRPLAFAYPGQMGLTGQGAYMLGDDLLVAPVLEPGARSREVRLPDGEQWIDVWSGARHPGGATVSLAATPGRPPVLCRAEAWQGLAPVFTI
ncbi:glycoside hydrolase family 31 protein [Ponticoccus sp. SC2-23]|uniref:glycoside hydrolase family 31 protein n=1 Tax=Alexandriicola marinus TaxID=2081710 RepID=UPI000FDA1A52|nr:TIM-barrel domain-containing protein [Alexandriicola marinus]MBM1218738.1 glycoside hydrolase family 31 protein [Ponticoccus sp. SC6-9]MBM1224190.1 glycoside hydrolase family 31 protein [Ponticoccus sp. SC6-15]MBM1230031.1 glycoside hydrolase family 31 protein [Ponticoccus sp. SC6-38]MBM1233156.1 glycoside hydrolase family 31 protein [Ponticoccus sp. SC6-45]MBM1236894.1 glycoside hydrolase family 31 protein [Ponticoccus sp. SC6-49]MBM1242167.1 glycoside hydrolase family 31 protein [Pontico